MKHTVKSREDFRRLKDFDEADYDWHEEHERAERDKRIDQERRAKEQSRYGE